VGCRLFDVGRAGFGAVGGDEGVGELGKIVAGVALEGAGVEGVVAGAAGGAVEADDSAKEIVAGAANEGVVAVAAPEGVVAVAGVDDVGAAFAIDGIRFSAGVDGVSAPAAFDGGGEGKGEQAGRSDGNGVVHEAPVEEDALEAGNGDGAGEVAMFAVDSDPG